MSKTKKEIETIIDKITDMVLTECFNEKHEAEALKIIDDLYILSCDL
jgi:hypothetical protein